MHVYKDRIIVTDLTTLNEEKKRLKAMCKTMEKDLNDRFDHVKSHAGSMAFNSLLPGVNKEKNVFKWGMNLGKAAWENEKIKSFFTTSIFSLLEYVAVRFGINFFHKHFGEARKK